eukprot:gnl/TRDRNA2_/TRDRNA2_40656_c0_seq2.p1 gnl/TRDRNA2_/TRDRNA2_40656_c0~~gnl/TRDRNA2_/TRDRNA2_40656_c0_seq2.p1  ORF type:complete len:355 (+),score=54.98 gnl/TRDRNA2_/TRDRNA2_40656_c0_seq2:52-1116(+)
MADAAVESTILSRPTFGWEEIKPVALRYGSFSYVKMLPSERDQNFLLADDANAGEQVVLKVHNPSDEPAFVELQNLALERAAASGASCQRLLRTTDTSELLVSMPLGGGMCQCRMLTFLPGSMLADAAAAASPVAADREKLWTAVGEAVASVTAALLDLDHPAAKRDFVWDLRLCEEVITARLADLTEERRPLVERFLSEYRRDIVPLLSSLRTSVVHNDPNDYNLVVAADGAVGVLDFGDMVHSYTCADAAIGAAYLLFHVPSAVGLADSLVPFIRGYHGRCAFTKAEAEALFGLAVMRVCTSVCMSAHQSKLEPDNEYLLISAGPAWALLERLASETMSEPPAATLCRACGL